MTWQSISDPLMYRTTSSYYVVNVMLFDKMGRRAKQISEMSFLMFDSVGFACNYDIFVVFVYTRNLI